MTIPSLFVQEIQTSQPLSQTSSESLRNIVLRISKRFGKLPETERKLIVEKFLETIKEISYGDLFLTPEDQIPYTDRIEALSDFLTVVIEENYDPVNILESQGSEISPKNIPFLVETTKTLLPILRTHAKLQEIITVLSWIKNSKIYKHIVRRQKLGLPVKALSPKNVNPYATELQNLPLWLLKEAKKVLMTIRKKDAKYMKTLILIDAKIEEQEDEETLFFPPINLELI